MGRNFGARPQKGIPPPPGSPTARKLGCRCPIAANLTAKPNESGEAVWKVARNCPLHGKDPGFQLPKIVPVRLPPPPKDPYQALRGSCEGYSRAELLKLDLRGRSLSGALSRERHPKAHMAAALLWEQEECAKLAEGVARKHRKAGRLEAADALQELAAVVRMRHPEPSPKPPKRIEQEKRELASFEMPEAISVEFCCPNGHDWIGEAFTTPSKPSLDLTAYRCPVCNGPVASWNAPPPSGTWEETFSKKPSIFATDLPAFASSYSFGPGPGRGISIGRWASGEGLWVIRAEDSFLSRTGTWVEMPTGRLPGSLLFDSPEEAYACLLHGQKEACPLPVPEAAYRPKPLPFTCRIPEGNACGRSGDKTPELCPFWSCRPILPHEKKLLCRSGTELLGLQEQEIMAFCAYLGEDDVSLTERQGYSLLWQQVKECGARRDLRAFRTGRSEK